MRSHLPRGRAREGHALKLSVVVTVVDGGAALERCLEALARQERAPDLELIVPHDSSVDVGAHRARFDEVLFLDLGTLPSERPTSSEAGRHELYDRRRSAGLAAASGELVALLEDRGAPRPDWARTIERLHRRRGEPALGGAIECASPGVLGKAVYLCDFGRYGLPRPEGRSGSLSDTNVAYVRAKLEQVRATWEERFHEPRVHAALEAHGGLWFSPEPVVDQRRVGLSLARLCAERFHWGRLFGAERARSWPTGRRVLFSLGAPLLPFLLWARMLDERIARERWMPSYLLAQVVLAPLLVAWSAGEAVGYLTRRA